MSSPQSNSPTSPTIRYSWQQKLLDYCKAMRICPPVWSIVSDRRGGRTAWSAKVLIEGHEIAARYWYDGQYVNNAKEDAAEVALQQLQVIQSPINSPPHRARTFSGSCNY